MRGPRHFFRYSSAEMLHAFFARAGHPVAAPAAFKTLREKVDWASDVANLATPSARNVFHAVMADVGALAGDLGAQCLRETMAARRAELVAEFTALKSDYDRGTWVWLRDTKIFDEAVARWFADRRRPAGSWTDAYVIPRGAALVADDFDLKGALMPIIDQYGGAPGVALERYALDPPGEGSPATLLSIFYEGRWNTAPRITNGQIDAVAARVVHQIAVQIDAATGVMHVISDTRSRKLRNSLAQAMAKAGLGLSGDLAALPRRRYNLQRLLDAAPFTWDPEHSIESICVPNLTLWAPSFGEKNQRTFSSGRNPEDVRAKAISQLSVTDRRLVRVVGGDLRVVFAPRPGRNRSRPVTLSFNGPESCGVNLDCAEGHLLQARYLDRWDLVAPLRSQQAPAR